jgi:hypothetical protein
LKPTNDLRNCSRRLYETSRQRLGEIPAELPGVDQVVGEPTADPQLRGDHGLRKSLLQQMFEQHERVPPVHRRPMIAREEAQLGGEAASGMPNPIAAGSEAQVCNFMRRFCAISGRR